MARIRSVHPGQWTDDEFVCCSPLARLLIIGLRNESDDNGIFEWNPVKLKMRLLPADNCDVAELLEEAAANNQVAMYEVGGKRFGIVRNFQRFQKIKAPTFIYPIPEVLPKDYQLNPSYFGSPTEIPPLREEGGGKREEVRGKEETPVPVGTGPGDCPHQEIVELYHAMLPMCPRVEDWTPYRQSMLRQRWREHPGIDWWRGFFGKVRESDFLAGRAEPSAGRRPFVANLEWLIRPKNFVKVLEGHYTNRKRQNTAALEDRL